MFDIFKSKQKKEDKMREQLKFNDPRHHILWEVDPDKLVCESSVMDIANWRRRVFYLDMPMDGTNECTLLIGNGETGELDDYMHLPVATTRFDLEHVLKINPNKTSVAEWEARLDEQKIYETMFVPRRVKERRAFPRVLYTFVLLIPTKDGGDADAHDSLVLGSEEEVVRTEWLEMLTNLKDFLQSPTAKPSPGSSPRHTGSPRHTKGSSSPRYGKQTSGSPRHGKQPSSPRAFTGGGSPRHG